MGKPYFETYCIGVQQIILLLDNIIFCCWPTNTETSNTCKSLATYPAAMLSSTAATGLSEAEVLPVLKEKKVLKNSIINKE